MTADNHNFVGLNPMLVNSFDFMYLLCIFNRAGWIYKAYRVKNLQNILLIAY